MAGDEDVDRGVLFDSSVLIASLDVKAPTDPAVRFRARKLLEDELRADDSAIAITPLIRYETLRAVPPTSLRAMMISDTLDAFTTFDITDDIARRAIELFRLESDGAPDGWNPDKRRFDAFHVATALVHDLELVSLDSGQMKVYRSQLARQL